MTNVLIGDIDQQIINRFVIKSFINVSKFWPPSAYNKKRAIHFGVYLFAIIVTLFAIIIIIIIIFFFKIKKDEDKKRKI